MLLHPPGHHAPTAATSLVFWLRSIPHALLLVGVLAVLSGCSTQGPGPGEDPDAGTSPDAGTPPGAGTPMRDAPAT
jgi:hypothetical protein